MLKSCSKIGAFDDTFRACYNRIPPALAGKLSAQDLADLVDAFIIAIMTDAKGGKAMSTPMRVCALCGKEYEGIGDTR